MRIQLSEHFNYGKLIRFVFPSIMMMIFTSIYGVVDGLFVSNFVGKVPFAAINLMMPLFMILASIGFMIGTGGSAIVAKTIGEGDTRRANRYFSLFVYATLIGGTLITVLGQIFLKQAAMLFGAEGEMLDCCVRYGRITISAMPFFMLQNVFQSFFVAAEKPKLGLYVIILAGVTNMVLDALLVVVIPLGLEGAALATAISQTVGGLIPIIYFVRKNDSLLKLTGTRFYGNVMLKTCANGSSELMSNISASIVTILFNYQLMKYAGDNGVAAYGVVMYVSFIIAAIFIGYSIGVAPAISYNFGADNRTEMKNIFKRSSVLILGTSLVMTALSFFLAYPLSAIFVSYDKVLLDITVKGFRIFSFSFLFCGLNIFGSAFFTSLNNGIVSAIISFMRTFVFQCIGVLTLPLLFNDGLDGVWLSIIVSEGIAFLITLIFIFANKEKYGYM